MWSGPTHTYIAQIARLVAAFIPNLRGKGVYTFPCRLELLNCVLIFSGFPSAYLSAETLKYLRGSGSCVPYTPVCDTLVLSVCMAPCVLSRKTPLWTKPPGDRARHTPDSVSSSTELLETLLATVKVT